MPLKMVSNAFDIIANTFKRKLSNSLHWSCFQNTHTFAAFLNISCSFPNVPHQIPASLAWSLGCLLLRKWTKCVVIGSKIDSGGVYQAYGIGLLNTNFDYYLIGVFSVPLIQQMNIISHWHKSLPEHLQLCCVYLWWNWSVAIPEQEYF